VREEVRQLLALGPLPAYKEVSDEKLRSFEELLGKISPPVTDDEARALIGLFGPDECYGLAWTMLHLIETAPGWPLWDSLGNLNNEWIRRLRSGLSEE
jgi:hypothetical protein